MGKRVTVLLGTTRGVFYFFSDENRQQWELAGPQLDGWEVYGLCALNGKDSLQNGKTGNRRLFAGTSHFVYGSTIRVSEDQGANWTQVEGTPRYTEESGFKLNRIWQIVPGHPSEPDTLFAGVEEAGLFKSSDGGTTWEEMTGLSQHPSRPNWAPGGGGLCLHTILIDPSNARRMWVGISSVGVFRTEDGGQSWKVCNKGLQEAVTGMPNDEVGRCVHKIVLDPENSDTLYCQFHNGVFKSTDAADSWRPVEEGLPSNFGFPMTVTSGGDLFVIPLVSEMTRHVKDGYIKVYRSENGGESWSDSSKGLPGPGHFVGVLRDAMAVDTLEPAGVYFGTTMGEVFCSPDSGQNWLRLPGQFPRITSIHTMVEQ